MKDLYAYDMRLTFDASKLKFKKATSGSNGFSIEPIVKNNEVRIAHTRVGKTAGDNGTVQMVIVTFEQKQSGDSGLSVHDVQLVDSKLNKATLKNTAVLTLKSGDGKPSEQLQFKDIKGHWAQTSILRAVELGWVSGYQNGTFGPEKEVTRAEFATMIIRATGLPITEGSQLKLSDGNKIPSWAKPYVEASVNSGILKGYEDGTFKPSQLITRAEMAAIVVRALDGSAGDTNGQLSFADTKQISNWAKPFVASAVRNKLMSGRAGNRFAPSAHATRAESVVVILSLLNHK